MSVSRATDFWLSRPPVYVGRQLLQGLDEVDPKRCGGLPRPASISARFTERDSNVVHNDPLLSREAFSVSVPHIVE